MSADHVGGSRARKSKSGTIRTVAPLTHQINDEKATRMPGVKAFEMSSIDNDEMD